MGCWSLGGRWLRFSLGSSCLLVLALSQASSLDSGPTTQRLTLSRPVPGAQYVAEAEEKLQRARLLVDSVRKEKVDLSNQLEEERR